MENKQLAQGIASLGRYGDTTLMHMRPEEVNQLTAISRANGGDITINPDTGMPEAFLGNFLKAAAPIAAGYFLPGSATLFGSQLGAQIAAGALTGAGIAALSGDNILGGAFTGGLGGMTGGGLNTAVSKAGTAATTAEANKIAADAAMGQQAAAQAAYTGPQSMMTNSRIIGGEGFKAANLAGPGPGGYVSNYTPTTTSMMDSLKTSTLPQTPAAQFGTNYGISDVAREFGGGSEAMGYGKMGLAGLGVAGQAGAFDPEPVDIGPREEERYDPTRRLNLGMDTGIGGSLRRDTGLRLLAQGGMVNNYANGGPAMYGMTPAAPPPKYGIIDVGGKFVETSKKPGPGLISDSDFKEQYQTTTAEKNQQGGGGGGMDPNLAPGGQGDDAGLNPGAIAALASGFAQQQMNPPTKSQTLGLEALAGGGYLETGGEVGDGMSDEIEATIEGEQEARLSDGEFVIPADVVSHLGNGSSDAGAKRLYEMMDKIRMARTGTKKQGKEINPERYMPA
jgi:hypothetical protein